MVYKSMKARLAAQTAKAAQAAEEKDPLLQSLSSAAEQNPAVLIRVLEAWLENSEPSKKMAA